jgi:hypothetical protein
LPTWCPSGDCPGVPAIDLRTGTLHSTQHCIWIEIDGQRAGTLWPAHYTATYVPLVVFDESGQQVAKEGDKLTTAIVGPKPTVEDSCGIDSVVELYFNPFATSRPVPS